jgi:hypothetical protein
VALGIEYISLPRRTRNEIQLLNSARLINTLETSLARQYHRIDGHFAACAARAHAKFIARAIRLCNF